MKRAVAFFCVMAATACCLAAVKRPWISGVTDRNPLEYRCGETMTFTLKLENVDSPPDGAVVEWTRTGDDGKVDTGKVPARSGAEFQVKTSLDRPGFVRIAAVVRKADGSVWMPDGKPAKKERSGGYPGSVFFDGGAGADVAAIRQSVSEPADFDAFWARHKAKLAEVPMDGATCSELPGRNPKVKIFMVSVPCAGPKPATGYLIVPAAEGRFPAEISFYGYGTSWSKTATAAPDGTRETGRVLKLLLSAHGFELNRDAAYYRAEKKRVKSNGYGHAFDPAQNADPEQAYFCGMTYRVMRGIEYLKSRREWNGCDLTVSGPSQGGLQSIWGAALSQGVTRARIEVPWCCDMGGPSIGRNHGEWFVEWVPQLGYYDPVNMARRIPKTCRVDIVRAGLGDYTCPPTGIAAFYNNLSGPKSIVWVQGSKHGYVPPDPQKIPMKRSAP